jgi:acyl carrier protein
MPDRVTVDTAAELRTWLTARVATLLGIATDAVRTDALLADYGLDSVYALTLASEIDDELRIAIEPTAIWDNPTIDDLVAYIVAGHFRPEGPDGPDRRDGPGVAS